MPVDVSPLREVLRLLEPDAQTVIRAFFERLVERRPKFKPLFRDTDWPRQRRMLLSALVLVAECDEEPDVALETVRALGRRHAELPLTGEDYEIFESTLRETLQEAIGEAWTTDVDRAWKSAMHFVVTTMRKAQIRLVE